MNLPNRITLIRIILVPVVLAVYLLSDILPYARLIAAIIFILAALTDFLDGYLARKLKMTTDLGNFLDTNADKMLSAIGFIIVLISIPSYNQNSVFNNFIIAGIALSLCREFMISALKQMAATKGVTIKADKFGKYKAAAQFVALAGFLAVVDISEILNIDIIYLFTVCFTILMIASVLAVVSAVNYFIKNKAVFSQK